MNRKKEREKKREQRFHGERNGVGETRMMNEVLNDFSSSTSLDTSSFLHVLFLSHGKGVK